MIAGTCILKSQKEIVDAALEDSLTPAVFLFDVDGVLVQPLGYRAAVRATVEDIAHRLGINGAAPDDETIAVFEAQGITCEWDMIPMTLAVLLEDFLRQTGAELNLDLFQSACASIPNFPHRRLQPDYAAAFRALGQFSQPGEAPADTLLLACQNGLADHLFPRLSRQGIMRDLLRFTRRPAQSLTTRIFETYALGNEVFGQSMRLPPEVQSVSTLSAYDRPLLSPQMCARLLSAEKQGRVRSAAYTARPSLPLSPSEEPLAVFAPEAEMALRLVGLDEIQLVGSGQMGEAAARLHEREDRLTKPAPYHALTAAAAALSGSRSGALEWIVQVYRFFEKGAQQPPLLINSVPLPPRFELHIFEDSPAGMRGGIEAAGLFAEMGCHAQLVLWGISDHAEKQAALQQAGAKVYPDINSALADAL